MAEQTQYQVRLSVPRVGGWRAWGAVSGEFEPVVVSWANGLEARAVCLWLALPG